jgi:hypothetical protein
MSCKARRYNFLYFLVLVSLLFWSFFILIDLLSCPVKKLDNDFFRIHFMGFAQRTIHRKYYIRDVSGITRILYKTYHMYVMGPYTFHSKRFCLRLIIEKGAPICAFKALNDVGLAIN